MELYDLYSFFVYNAVWNVPFPECTYAMDLKGLTDG